MKRLAGLWLCTAAAACSGSISKGLGPPLEEALVSCDEFGATARDWCAYEHISALEGVPGDTILTVCDRIGTTGALDRCLELAVRSEPPAASSTCDRMSTELMRSSCYIYVADVAARDGTIQDALDACAKTGTMLEHCLGHIPMMRHPRWTEQGGLASMEEDLAVLFDAVENLNQNFVFGSGVARAIFTMHSPQGANACSVFPQGSGRSECQRTYRELASGHVTQAGQGVPGR